MSAPATLELPLEEIPANIGRVVGPSEWVTVTQEMIDGYADAVNDRFWIHVDVPRATQAFGGTIAHGLLTLSLVPPLGFRLVRIAGHAADLNYGFEKLRFLSVVHGGDRIRLWVKILGAEPRGAGVLFRKEYTIEVEGRDKPAIVADWLWMVFPEADALAAQAGVAQG